MTDNTTPPDNAPRPGPSVPRVLIHAVLLTPEQRAEVDRENRQREAEGKARWAELRRRGRKRKR